MNIFVGNLATNVTPEDLKRLFSGFGTVIKTIVMKDTGNGKTLGYGHVYMEPDEAAREAIAELNHAPLKGKPIKIRVCRERVRTERRTTKAKWNGSDRRARSRRAKH
jgi:RNA recognition motif-containing protein